LTSCGPLKHVVGKCCRQDSVVVLQMERRGE